VRIHARDTPLVDCPCLAHLIRPLMKTERRLGVSRQESDLRRNTQLPQAHTQTHAQDQTQSRLSSQFKNRVAPKYVQEDKSISRAYLWHPLSVFLAPSLERRQIHKARRPCLCCFVLCSKKKGVYLPVLSNVWRRGKRRREKLASHHNAGMDG
jgi:hypothetical protein